MLRQLAKSHHRNLYSLATSRTLLQAPIIRRSLLYLGASSVAGALSYAYLARSSTQSFKLGNAFSSSASSSSSNKMSYPVQKDEDEWRLQLTPEQFRILRKKGTEMAGTGEYDKQYPTKGVFNCAGCDAPLYTYDNKFSSGCGWPAFFNNIDGAVKRHEDRMFGMLRTEIVCANCGGHLGHVFKGEGFGNEANNPKDERHCVNSVSIKLDTSNGNNV